MRVKRIILGALVLALSLLLTACGSTVATSCKTQVNMDGSGKRTLTLSVSRSDAAEGDVDVASARSKVEAATPSFATFSDASDSDTLRFVISYSFESPDEFSERAGAFGGDATLIKSGGLFTPAIELSETFTGSDWFDWALVAAGRTSSDIDSCKYTVTMPAPVNNIDGNGTVSGAEYSLTPSYSYDESIDISCDVQHDLASLASSTTIDANGKANRTLTLGVAEADAQAIVDERGGESAVTAELVSWAGDAWTASVVPSAVGVDYTLRVASSEAGDIVPQGSSAPAPSLVRLSDSNAYVLRETYTESFQPAQLAPDGREPGDATYAVTFPWAIEQFDAGGASVRQTSDRSLEWTGTGSETVDLTVALREVHESVLYPVSIGLLVVLVLGLAGLIWPGVLIARGRREAA